MSTKGITTTIATVAAIVTLIVGVIIGVVAYPALYPPAPPVGGVTQEEYDRLKSQFDTVNADLSTAMADLEDALKEIEDLKKAPTGLSGEVTIGFLGSMSGDLASYGENEATAAQLAVNEVNAILMESGEDWTLKLVVEDTQTLPDVTLEKVESLAARGIKLLIGPLDSSSLSNIMTYCNAEKVLTISQSSTAPELGFPDDYIYRFCPNDVWQGRAIARLMYEDGIEYVIPTWRGEAWGDGLEGQGKLRFEELGGTFDEGVRYSVPREEFSVEAAALKDLVTDAVATYGSDKVAVWAISFGEIAAYFNECSQYDILKVVKWYGSDGTCVIPEIIDPVDPEVSEFATVTSGLTPHGYINPIFSPLPATWKHEKVRNEIYSELGREPDSYSYSVYDIVWAYAYSLMAADVYDPEVIKDVMPEVVQELWGATGHTVLDANGDRKPTNYDLWVVEETSPFTYEWVRVGTWYLATDTIEWI